MPTLTKSKSRFAITSQYLALVRRAADLEAALRQEFPDHYPNRAITAENIGVGPSLKDALDDGVSHLILQLCAGRPGRGGVFIVVTHSAVREEMLTPHCDPLTKEDVLEIVSSFITDDFGISQIELSPNLSASEECVSFLLKLQGRFSRSPATH